jgi:hypothetical protein
MFYVERNRQGKIVAVRRDANMPGMELKESVDDEIIEFLGREEPNDSIKHILASTDVGVMRILEDLIHLLVTKNIIMSTELPEDAQLKLRQRQQMRQRIGKETFIVDDIL